MMMLFDILFRMKTNRAEYIECPIVSVVEQPPHGTHEAMQSGRGDPCGRPCCPSMNISLVKFLKIKDILGTPKSPRKGLPPLTNPWLLTPHRTHEAMQSGRGDPCGRPCCPSMNISLVKFLKIKDILGTPQTPRKGLPPLTNPWLVLLAE